jgi:hypothetical protein
LFFFSSSSSVFRLCLSSHLVFVFTSVFVFSLFVCAFLLFARPCLSCLGLPCILSFLPLCFLFVLLVVFFVFGRCLSGLVLCLLILVCLILVFSFFFFLFVLLLSLSLFVGVLLWHLSGLCIVLSCLVFVVVFDLFVQSVSSLVVFVLSQSLLSQCLFAVVLSSIVRFVLSFLCRVCTYHLP